MKHFKYTISLFLPAIAMILFVGCKTIQYVPVEKTEYVSVHDTTYLHRTDTLVQVPQVSIADFINISDTLRLNASYATATAWVDTTHRVLAGKLVQGGKLPVQIVERERVVYKDSISLQPYPVEVEKIVKVVPLFYKIFSVIGLALVFGVAIYLGMKFL